MRTISLRHFTARVRSTVVLAGLSAGLVLAGSAGMAAWADSLYPNDAAGTGVSGRDNRGATLADSRGTHRDAVGIIRVPDRGLAAAAGVSLQPYDGLNGQPGPDNSNQ